MNGTYGSFTDEQKLALAGDLDRSHVKSREQAGRQLSYIEGWHAIAEANRIFGFAGWTTETVMLHVVNASPCLLGKDQKPGHAVSYVARVRIVVSGVVREGVGAGHGRDRDLGLAHESAAKEAETDARKRALMTFGNKFGLALYDKEQRNVSAGADEAPAEPQPPSRAQPATREQATTSTLSLVDSKTWPFNLNDVVPFGKFKGSTWKELASGECGGERHSWVSWFVRKIESDGKPDELRKDSYRRASAILSYYGPMPEKDAHDGDG